MIIICYKRMHHFLAVYLRSNGTFNCLFIESMHVHSLMYPGCFYQMKPCTIKNKPQKCTFS